MLIVKSKIMKKLSVERKEEKNIFGMKKKKQERKRLLKGENIREKKYRFIN